MSHEELVLWRLRQVEQTVNGLDRKLDAIHDDVLTLKVRAGVWGAIGAGCLAVAIALAKALLA